MSTQRLFASFVALLATVLVGISVSPAWGAGSEAAPSWRAEWESVLAGAKKEGKVAVITGATTPEMREALTRPFQEKFGITVDFLTGRGAEVNARLVTELRAGQYQRDVYLASTVYGLNSLIPMGALARVEPALILPEIKEAKNWRGGAIEFADEGRQILVMALNQRPILFVNPNLAKPESFKSYKDLLDPRWKGKIVIDDPRKPGPGQASFAFFYLHPDLGPGFIRALAEQNPAILKDYTQEADAVGQGKYPILVGGNEPNVDARIKRGVPIVIVDPQKLREGSDANPGPGALQVFKKTPHPNAAKLYINWLLSREGQTLYARASGYISTRADVPTDHTYSWRVPRPGSIKPYTAEAREKIVKVVVPFLREVFGPS